MKIHYVANDGEIFLNPEDCVRYEMRMEEEAKKIQDVLPMMWNDEGERTKNVASAVIIKTTNLYELKAFIAKCKEVNLDCGIDIEKIWGDDSAVRRFFYSFDEDRFILVDNDIYEALWRMMHNAGFLGEI